MRVDVPVLLPADLQLEKVGEDVLQGRQGPKGIRANAGVNVTRSWQAGEGERSRTRFELWSELGLWDLHIRLAVFMEAGASQAPPYLREESFSTTFMEKHCCYAFPQLLF